MNRQHLFFAVVLVLLSATARAQEWAAYGTIGAEPTPGRICTGDANGKDILCASPAPYVDASDNVGIGTTSLRGPLDINSPAADIADNIYLTAYTNSTSPTYVLQRSEGTAALPTAVTSGKTLGALQLAGYDGAQFISGAQIQVIASANWSVGYTPAKLHFLTNNGTANSIRMTVDEAGNVGIGTTSSTHALVVAGDSVIEVTNAGNPQLYLHTTAGGVGWRLYESNGGGGGVGPVGTFTIRKDSDSTDKFAIAPLGNVGIGTTSPATTALLDVFSTVQGFLPPRMTTAQRDAISAPATGLTVYNSTTNALNLYTGSTWTAARRRRGDKLRNGFGLRARPLCDGRQQYRPLSGDSRYCEHYGG